MEETRRGFMAKLAAALVGSSQELSGGANFTGTGAGGERFQELLLPYASEFNHEYLVPFDRELAGLSDVEIGRREIPEGVPDDWAPEGFERKERNSRKIGLIPVRYDNQKEELHWQIDGNWVTPGDPKYEIGPEAVGFGVSPNSLDVEDPNSLFREIEQSVSFGGQPPEEISPKKVLNAEQEVRQKGINIEEIDEKLEENPDSLIKDREVSEDSEMKFDNEKETETVYKSPFRALDSLIISEGSYEEKNYDEFDEKRMESDLESLVDEEIERWGSTYTRDEIREAVSWTNTQSIDAEKEDLLDFEGSTNRVKLESEPDFTELSSDNDYSGPVADSRMYIGENLEIYSSDKGEVAWATLEVDKEFGYRGMTGIKAAQVLIADVNRGKYKPREDNTDEMALYQLAEVSNYRLEAT